MQHIEHFQKMDDRISQHNSFQKCSQIDSFILLSAHSWPYRFILGILFGSRLMAHGRLEPCGKKERPGPCPGPARKNHQKTSKNTKNHRKIIRRAFCTSAVARRHQSSISRFQNRLERHRAFCGSRGARAVISSQPRL